MIIKKRKKKLEDLSKIQTDFWSAITSIIPSTSMNNKSDIDKYVDLKRLSIYQSTVQTAHLLACKVSYPITANILGDSLFSGLAKGYFFTHLPTNPDLNTYGELFPQFLLQAAQEVPDLKKLFDLIEINKLAELEWTMEQGYFSKDEIFTEIDLQLLQKQSIDKIGFKIHPSVKLFQFNKTISPILKLSEERKITKEEITQLVKTTNKVENILVFREGWKMKYNVIDSISAEHIMLMQNEKTYEKLINMPNYQESYIQECLQKGIISGVWQIKNSPYH
jgi:hypothetical protein